MIYGVWGFGCFRVPQQSETSLESSSKIRATYVGPQESCISLGFWIQGLGFGVVGLNFYGPLLNLNPASLLQPSTNGIKFQILEPRTVTVSKTLKP